MYPPVSLYIIATQLAMLACIDFGRDGLCRGKEVFGKSLLVSITYLIFTGACVNIISSGHISQRKYEEAKPNGL
jgi:hypothetical protein